MMIRLLPLLTLTGAALALWLQSETLTPRTLLITALALVPCGFTGFRLWLHRPATQHPKPLERVAEAAALVALLLAGPNVALSGAALGFDLGAGMAHRERMEAGLPPKAPKINPFHSIHPGGRTLLHLLRAGVMVGLTAELLRRIRRQSRLAAAVQDQLLRAKLAPHFIFNTLNTLHAQIEANPRAAQATTERLAQLFRQVVQVADHPTIPLRQELSFVEAYLAIEQDRLGPRLRTVIDVPEALEDTPVPPLALQVLVENAVKHGVATSEAGGTVAIRATRLGSALQLCVTDSGQGLGSAPGTGTALDTLRQRLAKPEDLTLQRTVEGFRACFVWRHT